jgi:aminoglycoside 6'-N-acetyltransferase I
MNTLLSNNGPQAWCIQACTQTNLPDWLVLRSSLWPDCPPAEHRREMAAALAEPERLAQWLAYAGGQAVGLIEVALRRDYVNGTAHSPVAFVEGIYVSPALRRQGCARALLHAAMRWAEIRVCRELASDTSLDNLAGQRVHEALGFQETERVVYFRKMLPS